MAAPSASWSGSEAQSFIDEYFLAWEGTDEDLILSFYTDDGGGGNSRPVTL